MLGDRPLLAMMGLSKGGTNHLAQCAHACEGVVGLTEGLSHLIRPTRRSDGQLLSQGAVQGGVLKPAKTISAESTLAINKLNYTVVSWPESWVRFLSDDSNSSTVSLLRNPFMVHQSRVRFVRREKPQRTAWLDPRHLVRELMELLAMTWRLPDASIAFHERGLTDHHASLLEGNLGLVTTNRRVPANCDTCGTVLERHRRVPDDDNDWPFCPSCRRFVEGEGGYNFLRVESDLEAYRREERAALDDAVLVAMRAAIGRRPVEFFVDGGHWAQDGERSLRDILGRDPDRWCKVRLDEILYPY